MKDNRSSTTATWVAMGRALAHERHSLPGFSDPFALGLLPDDCRRAIEGLLHHHVPRSLREARLRLVAIFMEKLMGPRTVEIDRSLREMATGFQLVLMGAGLDARAYRLAELRESTVFEVDHPASQAFKRKQVEGLKPFARELRYVPVDFTQQQVAAELEAAGHSTSTPTAWVFEGVISYLSPRDVEASIAAMASRSAPGSRLLATYNIPPGYPGRLAGRFTAMAHEPQRASFQTTQMKELLARNGFVVQSDRDGIERLYRIGAKPSLISHLTRFHHVVVADRSATRAAS
jgi:methyltransferase (TIGR00027 family)